MSVVAKASIWAFLAAVIQKGASVLATPIFTRLLSPGEFAQYTLYQSWSDIFIIFSTLNVFNYAIYSGIKEYEEDSNSFISTSQIFITGLSLITFAIYFVIQAIFGDITGFPLPVIALMFLDNMLFAAFNIWAGKERYYFKYRILTFLSVLMGVLGPILGFIAIHMMSSAGAEHIGYGRIYGAAVANIIIGLIPFIYSIYKAKDKFKPKYIKFLLLYCIPLIPHFLASRLLVSFDRIMIDDICGATEAGIYGLAYSVSIMTLIVSESILKSLTPWTYQTIKKGKNLKKLAKNINILIMLVAIANLLLMLAAPEVIRIFATNAYMEAVYIIPGVSASVYYMFLFNVFANIEYYYSETKYITIASVGAAVLNIVLNLIFIRLFGYIAAGYTTLVCYIFYALCHYYFMRKTCKKHAKGIDYYENKKILLISVVFTILALAVIPLYQTVAIRYILVSIILIALIANRKKIEKLFSAYKI